METTTTTQKRSTLNYVLAALVLLLLFGVGFMAQRQSKAKAELQTEVNLRQALLADMVVTKDALGRTQAEKLSLQTDMKTLVRVKDKLSADKQQLVEVISRLDKNKKLITAALVKVQVEVKEIYSNSPAMATDSTATFVVATDSISYEAKVANVRIDTIKVPSLVVRNLKIPNTTQVSFQWGEKNDGYPISFTVVNSNPLFKTKNIESYAIPELRKEAVRPTFWQGIGLTIKNGKTPFVIGLGAGALGVLLLSGSLR